MEATQIEKLAMLRAIIGYLGERDQFAWWQSSFFAPGSRAFLQPIVGRTQLLAQCTGVTRAAVLIHDERIGVGNVYHLFRLPEDIEQAVHRMIQDPNIGDRITAKVASKDAALKHLHTEAVSTTGGGIGPTRVGGLHNLRDGNHWRIVAAHYLQAFSRGAETYPYFADRS